MARTREVAPRFCARAPLQNVQHTLPRNEVQQRKARRERARKRTEWKKYREVPTSSSPVSLILAESSPLCATSSAPRDVKPVMSGAVSCDNVDGGNVAKLSASASSTNAHTANAPSRQDPFYPHPSYPEIEDAVFFSPSMNAMTPIQLRRERKLTIVRQNQIWSVLVKTREAIENAIRLRNNSEQEDCVTQRQERPAIRDLNYKAGQLNEAWFLQQEKRERLDDLLSPGKYVRR